MGNGGALNPFGLACMVERTARVERTMLVLFPGVSSGYPHRLRVCRPRSTAG